MAGGMTAGRGPRRGEPVARTAAGSALLGRSGPAADRVPSGPSAPPPVEEDAVSRGGGRPADRELHDPAELGDPAELRRAHRHCWVLLDEADEAGGGAEADDGEPFAGVVAEWRLTPTGWLARVVYALGDGEMATVVESWLAAEQLRPA